MNIIVTGANGYIGRNVVRGLLDKGHQVTAMLFDGETPHHFLEGASLFYGNIFALSQDKKYSHDLTQHLAHMQNVYYIWLGRLGLIIETHLI